MECPLRPFAALLPPSPPPQARRLTSRHRPLVQSLTAAERLSWDSGPGFLGGSRCPDTLNPKCLAWMGSVSSRAVSPDPLDPRMGSVSGRALCPAGSIFSLGWLLRCRCLRSPSFPRGEATDAGGAAAGSPAKRPHLRVTVCATAPPRSSGHCIRPLRDCPQICEGLETEDTQPRREASAPQRQRPGNYSSVARNRRFPLRCRKSASFPSHAPSFLQLERRHCEERQTSQTPSGSVP